MMMHGYGLSLVTAPTEEPVTLTQARKQCDLPDGYSYHDEELVRLIAQARDAAELATARQFITATWDLFMDAFPCGNNPIYVPLPRLQSVVITYVDVDGATQTWSSSNYTVSTSREPGIVRLAYNVAYPATRYQPDAVKVRFTCGYGANFTAVPPGIRGAILLMVRGAFDNRSDIITGSIVNEMPAANNLLMQHYAGDEFTTYGVNRPTYSVSA